MASDSAPLCNEDFREKLKASINELNLLKAKNNWFHEYLVKYYQRKQMTYVASEDQEDFEILDYYVKKLLEFDAKDESDEEQGTAELEKYKCDISEKNREAEEERESLILRVKSVGQLLQQNGKLFSSRKIQNLLAKQLEKMNDINQFRLSYMKLKNKLSLVEFNLKSTIASAPNLTKEDYERLETENFYYNYELEKKKKICCNLIEKQNYLISETELIRSNLLEERDNVQSYKKIIDDLKKNIKILQTVKGNLIIKLKEKKQEIQGFREFLIKFRSNDFEEYMKSVHRDHEKWMNKISKDLKRIKRLGESLSAVTTNLILHGKNVELKDAEIEIKNIQENK